MASVYFNGEMITIPGAYSMIDASQMGTKGNSGTTRLVAFIGEAGGGEPETVHILSNPVAAKKVLKSGDLLKACNKAWNPVSKTKQGVSLGGANNILCIRTNRATKSALDVESGKITIKSKDWNADANNIQVRLADGTHEGTRRFMVYNQDADIYENLDNIGGLFSIKYTGTEPYAEVNVFKDDVAKEYVFQTKIGADKASAVEDIHITLGALEKEVIKSMTVLISMLRSYENYSVVPSFSYNTAIKVTKIDPISAEIMTDPVHVTAFYHDLKAKVAANSNLIEIESYDNTQGLPANFDYTYLTGGSDGTTKATWVEYLDMLSNYDITYIVPLTGDTSIHAEVLSHVQTMSGTKGRERRMIVGGEIGEAVTDAITRAKNLSSDRAQVVCGGFFDYDEHGVKEIYAPYILAAQHAGRCAFLDDGEAATHDVYKMAAPEYILETTQIQELIAAGVLAFEFVIANNTVTAAQNTYVRLVHDLTTDIGRTQTVYTERAVGVLADSINKEIREKIDSILTGKRTTITDLTTVKNAVISILWNRQHLYDQILGYKDIYITKEGTVTTIDYSVAPAEPNNFTIITAHYYDESISID